MKNNKTIKEFLLDKNIFILGFADLSEVNAESRLNLQYGIVFGIALKIFPSLSDTPSVEYYNEYKSVSKQLRKISYLLENKIQGMGYKAYSLARNHQNEQFKTPLPFKTLATRAGLGWIGKSGTLITKEYGNAVRISGVITDMPFDVGKSVNQSFCGECCECVQNCPAKAIIGSHWNLETERNNLLDPFACNAKVIERGKIFGVTDGSCGICISVCPWTKKYISSLQKQNSVN